MKQYRGLGRVTVLVVVFLSLHLTSYSSPAPPAAPNVIFIITDDHRYDAMGCAGRPELRTPNLDRLAAEGIRFTNAFVTTSLCSPSRASFLNGCYAHRHGVVANEVNDPPADLPTFPEVFQAAGYHTVFFGKWHMQRKATARRGFDKWVSFTGQGEYYRNTIFEAGEWYLNHEYITDLLTRRAVDYIQNSGGEPFLMVVSHKAAHAPFFPAQRHRVSYQDVAFPAADDPDDDLAGKPDWGGRAVRPDNDNGIREYHQCLLAVDEGLGSILKALADMGILDETIVVYAGDNGYLHGEHAGLWDKRAAYEPSIRIPLLLRYPHVGRAGKTCDELILNVDVAPSLIAMAGLEVPSEMQGNSWQGVLAGEPGRKAILYEYFRERGKVPTCVAVRTRDWKLITYPDDPRFTAELYDLENDPLELYNLWRDPAYGTDVERMQGELERVMTETGYGAPAAR